MENIERYFMIRHRAESRSLAINYQSDSQLEFSVFVWDNELGMKIGGSIQLIDVKFPDGIRPDLWIMIIGTIEKYLHQEVDRELNNILAGRQFIKPSIAMENPSIDFSCRVCGIECDLAPNPPARAICPEHCEDHAYQYQPFDRERRCVYCNGLCPDDFYD